jgi:hypothetical protein
MEELRLGIISPNRTTNPRKPSLLSLSVYVSLSAYPTTLLPLS